MATRSNIGYVLPNGNARMVYAHWDGYIACNGRILHENYQQARKIAQLIELGDISSLGAEIGRQHSFDARDGEENWTTFYGRDRGETGIAPVEVAVDDMLQNEYAYLWNGTEWLVSSVHLESGWHSLADMVAKTVEEAA